ncbi:hypothetical protein E1293_45925 [Actinomadura darangshiensis]|uniref:Uncharacterized protein n=1 Tax=Actinomadura darangshiensis TaxID=705336 RepID=A0A4R4ZMQ3_9ACTN|nr:hypothetical protein [Actinomadura darangshiensis]TDD60131.1 hypothetical protein E1293_45925 [Actinomadura darangshiensis]
MDPFPDGEIWYDVELPAESLTAGMRFYYDEDVYVTVTALIFDEERHRVIAETRGDHDGRKRVYKFPCETEVYAGVITQYGIARSDQRDVMPVHTKHGARARGMALDYIARRGGRLMKRPVIPGANGLTGTLPVGEFEPAP